MGDGAVFDGLRSEVHFDGPENAAAGTVPASNMQQAQMIGRFAMILSVER